MSLRHLEHDGNEDFDKKNKKKFPNRDEDTAEAIIQETKQIIADEQQKQKDQEEWMSMDNPFLWVGDI